jgi:hypothetical protein
VSLPRHAHRSPDRARDPHLDETAGLTGIPFYPELRNCPAPSAERILEIFTGIQRHHLIHDDTIVQTFEPAVTPLQQQVLDLLRVPTSVYTTASES